MRYFFPILGMVLAVYVVFSLVKYGPGLVRKDGFFANALDSIFSQKVSP
ncbi:MAG: hypothetical protein UY12_C0016G0004 [Parcubacteria group bacterium GW2011_GWA2_47_8b]|nr:MAG: hypothetical protein UY12_C0016G0004 [Parcubacteria group bacterium GW2011_GWA2_47_8b]